MGFLVVKGFSIGSGDLQINSLRECLINDFDHEVHGGEEEFIIKTLLFFVVSSERRERVVRIFQTY